MEKKYNEEILEKCLPPYLENDLKNLYVEKNYQTFILNLQMKELLRLGKNSIRKF